MDLRNSTFATMQNIAEENISSIGNNSLQLSATVRDRSAQVANQQCMFLSKLIIHSVISGIICILGFTGNSVSIWVLRQDRESPVATFLLQALAFTDNFFLSLCFIHFCINDLLTYLGILRQLHITWWYIRIYTYPLIFIGQTATIWMTVLIAISRYIAVCVPYRASELCNIRRMKLAVTATLLASIIYNMPRFFEKYLIKRTTRRGRVRYTFDTTSMATSAFYRIGYFDIMYYVFSFVLPLLLLSFLNTRLIWAYRAVQRKRRALRSRTLDTHDHNITLVMIIVIVVFMLCNAPARISQIAWKYHSQECFSVAFFISAISNVLEILNSSTNFIIYCAFRRQFRTILGNTRFCAALSTRARGVDVPCSHSGTEMIPTKHFLSCNDCNDKQTTTAVTEIEL